MNKKSKKPLLTAKQINEIQWVKNAGEIRVGRYKEYWILSQKKENAPVLVYDQMEWDAFVDGVVKHEFDDLVQE